MGGGMRGFEAAALVDGDIHYHRAALHFLKHGAAHEFGCGGARDQYRADDQIGLACPLVDAVDGRVHTLDAARVLVRQMPQSVERFIENADIGAEADGHLRGVITDHPATDDQHLARCHARHATKQDAGAALRHFQAMRAGLHREASGHFAHRCEQRQAAVAVGDGLVGDRRYT